MLQLSMYHDGSIIIILLLSLAFFTKNYIMHAAHAITENNSTLFDGEITLVTVMDYA